ncbi:neural Wiskott-Aldrich syndrome protein-like [Phacochoerus africanus]|uniref:neural Wiskott-Aldrich syndrome protein-like n=1 Tax=Phacochoerus africanus TaxID=41426 RepID=UPI001FD95201|nr:neural Wiskott-Aldrich syndrome protein-like [Phacochoerus africanus]
MPALRHCEKGRFSSGRKSSAELRSRSPGRPVPERSDPAPTPPPPPLLRHPFSSPLASLRGTGGVEPLCKSTVPRSRFPATPPAAPAQAELLASPAHLLSRLSSALPALPAAPAVLSCRWCPAFCPAALRRPQFCVLKRRLFPAQRG